MTALRTTRRHRTGTKTIQVRMYNVGFGDCFLLRLPTAEGERRVLLDCGYHSQGQGSFTDKELVQQILADLAGDGLDVVIATHRHQDHISGFGETELWKAVGVTEVWLPFTADETDPRDPVDGALERLRLGVTAFVGDDGKLLPAGTAAMAARTERARDELTWLLWNARANAPGIENLLRGFKQADGRAALRRFLPERDSDVPFAFTTPALPGVGIHVLGPSRDPKYRRSRQVPSSWGAVGEPGAAGGAQAVRPFGDEWTNAHPAGRLPFTGRTIDEIRAFNDDLLAAAKAVDGFLNGESLVLVLELGSARLLLPGDAEVAAWTKILENPTARALAESATFLKVGHHGSHNATPLPFIRDHVTASTLAMISTQEGTEPFRNGIPFKSLLTELQGVHAKHVRSDQPGGAAAPFKGGGDGRWIDCRIPC